MLKVNKKKIYETSTGKGDKTYKYFENGDELSPRKHGCVSVAPFSLLVISQKWGTFQSILIHRDHSQSVSRHVSFSRCFRAGLSGSPLNNSLPFFSLFLPLLHMKSLYLENGESAPQRVLCPSCVPSAQLSFLCCLRPALLPLAAAA